MNVSLPFLLVVIIIIIVIKVFLGYLFAAAFRCVVVKRIDTLSPCWNLVLIAYSEDAVAHDMSLSTSSMAQTKRHGAYVRRIISHVL